ncbi:phage tail sheath family protein [Mycetohabitans rhizoxinica]|uniref:phage tail sheath family protein n=1 Tax=Mycetohabitans rhizoxinica TaxID=412963 RepID=UPI0030CEFCCB
MNVMKTTETAWPEPGVKLMSTIDPVGANEDVQASAVPVFIGWWQGAGQAALRLCNASMAVNVPAGVLRDTLKQYFDNGGECAFVLSWADPESANQASCQMWQTWWNQRLQSDLAPILSEPSITLVAVPQLVPCIEALTSFLHDDQTINDQVADALIEAWRSLLRAVHASRSDLFFVLDAPSQPKVAKHCIDALRKKQPLGELGQHAALYGPHLVTDYRSNNKAGLKELKSRPYDGYRIVPPCGAVLGVIARTDREVGVWKAPANEALSHVLQPQYLETQASGWFDVSRASINLIRSFPGRGTRVWGCRTLAGEVHSPFRYVQVRRLVTWIEANLRERCRFAMFEPNHEVTWFQLRGLCSAWLRQVWLDGGLAGADETSAYSVQVGLNETLTQADINAGRLMIRVAVAVLHAAERIEIKLVLKLGDTTAAGTETVGGPLT